MFGARPGLVGVRNRVRVRVRVRVGDEVQRGTWWAESSYVAIAGRRF